MSNENQAFLEAEEAADQLIKGLSELKKEAVAYQSGTKELGAAREKLVSLIEAFQGIAHDTSASVKLLQTIGGPQILAGLGSILQLLKEQHDDRSRLLGEIGSGLELLRNRVETSEKQTKQSMKITMFCLIISSLSLFGILFLVIK